MRRRKRALAEEVAELVAARITDLLARVYPELRSDDRDDQTRWYVDRRGRRHSVAELNAIARMRHPNARRWTRDEMEREAERIVGEMAASRKKKPPGGMRTSRVAEP